MLITIISLFNTMVTERLVKRLTMFLNNFPTQNFKVQRHSFTQLKNKITHFQTPLPQLICWSKGLEILFNPLSASVALI